MGNQKPSGLTKRGGVWPFDKLCRGTRIRGSSGTGNIVEAREQLAKRCDLKAWKCLFHLAQTFASRVTPVEFVTTEHHKTARSPTNPPQNT